MEVARIRNTAHKDNIERQPQPWPSTKKKYLNYKLNDYQTQNYIFVLLKFKTRLKAKEQHLYAKMSCR